MLDDREILVDKYGDRLVSEVTKNIVKGELKVRQMISDNYVFMNCVRIVQQDDVEHILKLLPACPNVESMSHYCFSHPSLDIHWHYEIISSNMKSVGLRRWLSYNDDPTWYHFKNIEDGAQLFLMKMGDTRLNPNNIWSPIPFSLLLLYTSRINEKKIFSTLVLWFNKARRQVALLQCDARQKFSKCYCLMSTCLHLDTLLPSLKSIQYSSRCV